MAVCRATEPRQPRHRIGKVDSIRQLLIEFAAIPRWNDLADDGPGLLGGERSRLDKSRLAGNAHHGRRTGLEVKVAGVRLDREAKQFFELQAASHYTGTDTFSTATSATASASEVTKQPISAEKVSVPLPPYSDSRPIGIRGPYKAQATVGSHENGVPI